MQEQNLRVISITFLIQPVTKSISFTSQMNLPSIFYVVTVLFELSSFILTIYFVIYITPSNFSLLALIHSATENTHGITLHSFVICPHLLLILYVHMTSIFL